jgi:hypothetical protein
MKRLVTVGLIGFAMLIIPGGVVVAWVARRIWGNPMDGWK